MAYIQRKKCKYLDNHICPLSPSIAEVGTSCDGCALFEKILSFKNLSIRLEEFLKKENKE